MTETTNPMNATTTEAAERAKFTYLDCLRGATPVPKNVNGATLINYFIVGPIAKLVFINKISPSYGLGLLGNLEAHAPTLARLLGC